MSAETEAHGSALSPWVTRGGVVIGILGLLAVAYVAYTMVQGGGLTSVTAADAESSTGQSEVGGLEALEEGTRDLTDRLVEYSDSSIFESEYEVIDGVTVPVGMPTDAPDELGLPLDPLSEEEAGFARFRALQELAGSGQKADGTDGYEFQYVQIPSTRASDETRRLAEVVLYDYADDVVIVQEVDLATGEVEPGVVVSPPTPNRAETLLAMEIFLDSPESAQLRAQYEEWTGEALESADDFYFAGGVYLDPLDGSVGIPECETARCVQFNAITWDGMVLVPGDFAVDLSAGVVRENAS